MSAQAESTPWVGAPFEERVVKAAVQPHGGTLPSGSPQTTVFDSPIGAVGSALPDLLTAADRRGASDVLLVAGAPPTHFVGGQWSPLHDIPLTSGDIVDCIESILTEPQCQRLHEDRDVDLGITFPRIGRYRVNVHYQRGTLAAAFRRIPPQVPAFDQLNLPSQVLRLADAPHGLVLVTGGTGQGKSTTLAALIEHMNRTRAAHIITIEDPVEFNFEHGRCVIEQRQIGEDSPSFSDALRHVLRQRPDVILIGEMRDRDTIATALTASETGHLVLASLHTADVTQTLTRIVDVFPAGQQPQIRTQLAGSLRGVVCQTLVADRQCPHATADRRVPALTPATELLFASPAIRRTLRENEPHLLYGMLETGRSAGMHTLEQSLAELVAHGRIAPDEALAAASEPGRLERLLKPSASGRPNGGASSRAGTPGDRR
ncbi:MAG: type IV pilus twitching motility protein PilT [Phycisphaerae bacterium]